MSSRTCKNRVFIVWRRYSKNAGTFVGQGARQMFTITTVSNTVDASWLARQGQPFFEVRRWIALHGVFFSYNAKVEI